MTSLPNAHLNLEWVYGYRGHQCRNNLYYNKNGELVYFVAGVAIVFNTSEKRQKFYFGHNDDIISLVQHPDGVLIATGQVGKQPYMCVWDSTSLETISILKDAHEHGIVAIAFSTDGQLLASVGSDQSSTIVLWEWRKGRKLAVTRGHSDRVFDVQFFPQTPASDKTHQQKDQRAEYLLVTCGVKHIKFWTHSGNTLTAKKGIFGNVGEIQTMLSLLVCNSSSGNNNNLLTSRSLKETKKKLDVVVHDGGELLTFSTTLSGDVYMWCACTLTKVFKSLHKGPIFTIAPYRSDQGVEGLMTGGKDGVLKIWNLNMQLMKTHDLKTDNTTADLTIRSLYQRQQQILIGTKDSEIIQLSFIRGGAGDEEVRQEVVMEGHKEGELWGLDVTKGYFATASDDKTVRIWELSSRMSVRKRSMEEGMRCCSFNHDASLLAVGMLNGSVALINTKSMKVLKAWKDRKEVIHEMKHSADGRWLAVGSNDNFVDVYDCNNDYKKVGVCTGNSSFITHLDWSVDGRYITTNSGAAEKLIFNMPDGKRVTNSEEIKNIKWLTFTGVLGNEVKGIWQKYTDTNDINATDVIDDVIATADDFGLVKLFKFPSYEKGAKHHKYIGHSAHVTNCRFTKDGQSLLSVGGADHAIFQWQFVNGSNKMTNKSADGNIISLAAQPSSQAFDDDGDEDNDPSSPSSVAFIDSDIEKENERTYERAVNKKEIMMMQKMKKREEASKRKTKITALANRNEGEAFKTTNQQNSLPDASLRLDHVIGYRGFDSRHNVFYLPISTSNIVFHSAAVGIVYDKEQKMQRFYLGHDDDILSLTVHPNKDIVASGQIGKSPDIHVWEGTSMKTVSILKGGHQRGVSFLDFTADGKKLASVGLDDNHMIVVWDWRKGAQLASTRGHKDKIYMLKWNPFDGNKLVTVGNKHIKFWCQAGNGFNSNRGVFGNVSQQETVLCVAYGNNAESCFSAGNSGLIHCWGNNILLKVIQGHQGPVFSMYSSDGLTFVTGGKDGTVITWTNQFVDRHHVVVIDSSTFNGNNNKHNLASSSNRTSVHSNTRCIKSAVIGGGGNLLLVGTKESEVVEVNISSNQIHVIEQGHGEGEMWGLATHPNKMYFATVSDDCTLRLWSVGTSGPTLALIKYLDRPSRCVAFSNDGGLLVAGMTDGSFVIFNSTTLTEKMKVHKRKQNISDMKFSPDPGAYLAVASHDNFVDIYNASTCQLVGVCKGASSYVTHLDWNDDGSVLQVNTGAREHLFYQAPRGNRITPTLTDIENFVWSTFTGVLGPMCAGIWSPYSDVTDVNSSSLTRDRRYLVTGDDLGLVKLFNFPAKLKNSKHKRYMGHSAHVTNVRWMCDGRTLISIGGDDASILIWKLIGGPEQVQLEPVTGRENRSMNGVTYEPGRSAKVRSSLQEDQRSNVSSSSPRNHHHQAIQSEDSNSDGSDEGEDNIPGGYDSDVDREAKIDYVPKFNIDPLRGKQAASNVGGGENDGGGGGDNGGGIALNKENTVVDSVKFLFSRRIENKNFSTPEKNDLKIDSNEIKGLQLKLVYGYRGMDTRNNLHYLDHAGAEIVYHTAATVVVVDVATGCQRFYLGHSDDIISLATNQNPRYKGIVATGDIGQRPTIHVWHSKTMSTNSVLSGVLKGGVVSVDFSCGGKLLVAVGLDEEHTIVVYNWVEGTSLASSPGHPHRIFHCEYRPDSDNHFVSVGVRHISFWDQVGGALVQKRGVAKSPGNRVYRKVTFLSLAFGMNNTTYSGSVTGDVYVWRDVELVRVVQMIGRGPIFSMFTSLFDGLIVTGCKERNESKDHAAVKLWDQEMSKCKSYSIPSLWDNNDNGVLCVKSLSRVKGKILVGTKDSNIFEVNEKTAEVTLVASYHGDGELWGLTNHRNNKTFATTGDDGMLKIWDIHKSLALKSVSIGPCRTIHFSSTGSLLAAGLKNGTIKIFETSKYDVVFEKRFRGSVINVIKFSPNDGYVVTLSEDSFMDMYEVNAGVDSIASLTRSSRDTNNSQPDLFLKRLSTFNFDRSTGISLDFSDDCQFIKVGTDAYTNRYFQVPTLTEVLDAGLVAKIFFTNITSVSGSEMVGAWPRNASSRHHVNCCHVSSSHKNVVTGDDYGLVKLLKFPANLKNVPFQYYVGHSAHVTNILFTSDQSHVVSIGGDDSSILVWQCLS